MDSQEFRKRGREMVDYIANYVDTVATRKISPEVQPGYLRNRLPARAPESGETFDDIMEDVEKAIMPGIQHFQHPRFHGYFPTGNSFPSLLGDLLADSLGIISPTWASSPAATELEKLMCDWLAQMIGLPPVFLNGSGQGGGVIQTSSSECVLFAMLTARKTALDRLKVRYPQQPDGILMSKLVAYSSSLAHSCVEKASKMVGVTLRHLGVDDKFSVRGPHLHNAIKKDEEEGLIPFFVLATVGSTPCCSFDNVQEMGEVCAAHRHHPHHHRVWLHVDAAYAGNALICPEFQPLIKGIENCDSLSMSANKGLQVNFDCAPFWVRDAHQLTSSFSVFSQYLRHSNDELVNDLRNWGILLSRRFRALKLWFVFRMFGVSGLQKIIRQHVHLAKTFEGLVRQDQRFEVIGDVVLGLVCFRLKGPGERSEKLLERIVKSGELYMISATVCDVYVIRFCVYSPNTTEDDISYAWDIISGFTNRVEEIPVA